jgi:hypothetical protein
MQKIFNGFEFYFVPKKQIRTQVVILKKRIEERGGAVSSVQRSLHGRRSKIPPAGFGSVI